MIKSLNKRDIILNLIKINTKPPCNFQMNSMNVFVEQKFDKTIFFFQGEMRCILFFLTDKSH